MTRALAPRCFRLAALLCGLLCAMPADAAAPPKGQDAAAKALSERIRQTKATDAAGQLQLGLDLRNGNGLKKDPVLAYKWIHQAALGNLAEAQFVTGMMDMAGEGTARKPLDGIEWLKKSAKLGYGPAIARLALLYRIGDGVAPDLVQSARFYRQMAERNDVASQLILADCYLHGAGVLKSPLDAAIWLRHAAQLGSAEARYRLAVLLLDAETPKYVLQHPSRNSREAVTWLQLSADEGFAPAQLTLGIAAIEGLVVPPDRYQGLTLIFAAADQGYTPALRKLGDFYRTGMVTPKDPQRALLYLEVADMLGDRVARFEREDLLRDNPALQQSGSRRRAQEWLQLRGM